MLEELFHLHEELMSTIDLSKKRFLYDIIRWDSRVICLYGARGVGKTTLLCQYLLEKYQFAEKALYLSGDNVHVLSRGLLNLASHFFSLGGEALFIDEVHKYPNWSIEIKNIVDTFRTKQIIFSGSSAMELKQSKGDLSRRVVYYELPGFSFREFLDFTGVVSLPSFSLEEILSNHTRLVNHFRGIPVLKFFNEYLTTGYYPYFLESKEDYMLKLNNVIEKVLFEDIPFARKLKQSSIILLKKLLWLVATSTCLVPNIDKISKNLGVAREAVYNGFTYLEQAGLIQNIYPEARGMKLIRKPGKIYLNNTNLLYAINGSLSLESDIGAIRETFFSNQLRMKHSVNTHEETDFSVDQKYIFEVGGKNKNEKQIQFLPDAYLALDGLPIGLGNRIPLYLFGCLY